MVLKLRWFVVLWLRQSKRKSHAHSNWFTYLLTRTFIVSTFPWYCAQPYMVFNKCKQYSFIELIFNVKSYLRNYSHCLTCNYSLLGRRRVRMMSNSALTMFSWFETGLVWKDYVSSDFPSSLQNINIRCYTCICLFYNLIV